MIRSLYLLNYINRLMIFTKFYELLCTYRLWTTCNVCIVKNTQVPSVHSLFLFSFFFFSFFIHQHKRISLFFQYCYFASGRRVSSSSEWIPTLTTGWCSAMYFNTLSLSINALCYYYPYVINIMNGLHTHWWLEVAWEKWFWSTWTVEH